MAAGVLIAAPIGMAARIIDAYVEPGGVWGMGMGGTLGGDARFRSTWSFWSGEGGEYVLPTGETLDWAVSEIGSGVINVCVITCLNGSKYNISSLLLCGGSGSQASRWSRFTT